ncbi:peptide/nickel transport system substrate-binding protein [Microbacterium sp. ru370.1]|uniref:ABC transporter substrate-binding protein n=1 Tax=unclassified Microbacterium TaxID=2609290 RepID=UPI00088B8C58|nr:MULTISPECIES: ABC transporter substrate-binding protein [unclassified Microbacterium]SDO99086.1 peptide/nickel transport system substrate-binding protein [Microbacterium sp. ru370.1]SIT92488.1 peptide/nickel transport system substrate-binding protein [Microbacterium sp. RU1D]
MSRTPLRRFWRALVATAAVATLAGSLSACAPGGGENTDGQILRVASIGNASFTRNFNPFSPTALDMSKRAVYEPLMVANLAKGEIVPWLAKNYEWSADGLTLTFTLNDGTTWSDGKPLTAADVVYTFDLSRKVLGDATYDYVGSASAPDDTTVEFSFTRPYTPGLYELGGMLVVPQHVWETVDDPSTYQNPDPVGSGPFTQVANFSAQSYDLMRNPNYWQKDKADYGGIRVIAYGGNDAANIAAINGDIDFGLGFIQDIQKTYVDVDPEHRGYWFPAVGSTISLSLNTTQAPYDDVNLRKAVSMGIDRDAVAKKGMSGYTHPSDCTGLSDAYDSWRDQSVVASCDWTTYDVTAANALLDASGYPRGADGMRTTPAGTPLTFNIGVGSASTDWIAVAQVISDDMKDLGISAPLRVQDWSQINQELFGGTYTGNIAWSAAGVTPYEFYRSQMSCKTVKPVGEEATQNFHRFCSEKADQLLDQFAAATDEAAQHDIMNQLQAVYSETAPQVPLFPGPEWGAYNSTNFVGWPSEDDPYATLSPSGSSTVLVLTTIHPRG